MAVTTDYTDASIRSLDDEEYLEQQRKSSRFTLRRSVSEFKGKVEDLSSYEQKVVEALANCLDFGEDPKLMVAIMGTEFGWDAETVHEKLSTVKGKDQATVWLMSPEEFAAYRAHGGTVDEFLAAKSEVADS